MELPAEPQDLRIHLEGPVLPTEHLSCVPSVQHRGGEGDAGRPRTLLRSEARGRGVGEPAPSLRR